MPAPKFEICKPWGEILLIPFSYHGVVYAALHRPTGKQVAIKKIIPFDHPVPSNLARIEAIEILL